MRVCANSFLVQPKLSRKSFLAWGARVHTWRFLDRSVNPSDNVCLPAAVAQVVDRSPEKAGVGGSTPSRGTILINNLPISTITAVGTERNNKR